MYSLQHFDYEYDEDSLMHYKRTEFSKNGLATIESKLDRNRRLGNTKYFTKIDIQQINELYQCLSRYLNGKSQMYQVSLLLFTIVCTQQYIWAGRRRAQQASGKKSQLMKSTNEE